MLALYCYCVDNVTHAGAELDRKGGEFLLSFFKILKKLPWLCSYIGLISHLKCCFRSILEKKSLKCFPCEALLSCVCT